MRETWRTMWQGHNIVIYREDEEVERLRADTIRRVIFVESGAGTSASDLAYAVVETDDECLVLPAETGFAGAVHFERQNFWAERQCVYWTDAQSAILPPNCRNGLWFRLSRSVRFTRMPRAELAPVLEQWSLEGPQTWDERRWERIQRGRPFAGTSPMPLQPRAQKPGRAQDLHA